MMNNDQNKWKVIKSDQKRWQVMKSDENDANWKDKGEAEAHAPCSLDACSLYLKNQTEHQWYEVMNNDQ